MTRAKNRSVHQEESPDNIKACLTCKLKRCKGGYHCMIERREEMLSKEKREKTIKRKPRQTTGNYIICLFSSEDQPLYIVGGAYKRQGERFAYLTSDETEARTYATARLAEYALMRFRTSCKNVGGRYEIRELTRIENT